MKILFKQNADLRQCLKDILDAYWDMSPLEFAQSRGHSHMSDEIGEDILDRARKLIKGPEPPKDGHIFYQPKRKK